MSSLGGDVAIFFLCYVLVFVLFFSGDMMTPLFWITYLVTYPTTGGWCSSLRYG